MINSPEPYIVQVQEPEFIDFADERLELGYDYGVVGGPEFKTEVIEVADGREQRNVLRHLPLGRWQLGQRQIAESEVDKLEEVSYLLKFHEDRKGAKQGFRFKDWADYRGVAQVLGVGDGITTQFQLRKAYAAGNALTYRPIQKPVIGTVDILVDGVNVAVDPNHTWIVDHETGIVSNDTPLANGAVLSANFEFDVPVWFESDELPFTLGYYNPETERQLYELGSVFVVEGRLPLTLPWDIAPRTEITEELNLGIVYQTTGKFQYKTTKLALNSGFTNRESKREEARILFDYGDRTFDQAELDTLLGYFWNARGKAGEFPIEDKGDQYIVRFNADRLNIKFEAASDDDALFKVSGLKLQLKEKVILRLPILPGFVLNTESFDISDIEGLSPNHIELAQNNYTTYGGGSFNSSGNNSNSTGKSGIAASSGSIGVSFQNEPDVTPARYPFLPHVWGEFDGIPFAIGSVQTGFSNSSPKWLCFAYISDPFSGQFTITKIGNHYIEMQNGVRIQGLGYQNGNFIAVVAARDLDDGMHKSLTIEVSESNQFEYSSTPLTSNNNSLSNPGFYVDDQY